LIWREIFLRFLARNTQNNDEDDEDEGDEDEEEHSLAADGAEETGGEADMTRRATRNVRRREDHHGQLWHRHDGGRRTNRRGADLIC